MHLSDTTLDHYLARSLDRAQLRLLDDHVTSCLPCALSVEARALEPERWQRRGVLGRLAPVVPAPAQRVELERAA